MAISNNKQIPKITAFCIGSADRKHSSSNINWHHYSKRRTRQGAGAQEGKRVIGYVAHFNTALQGPQFHKCKAVCIRRRARKRDRKDARRMDEAVCFIRVLAGQRAGSHLITARGFIRGGNWDNGANSGAFTLNLNNAPSNVNTNIGFRCARYLSKSNAGQNKALLNASPSQRKILMQSFSRNVTLEHDNNLAQECVEAYRAHTSTLLHFVPQIEPVGSQMNI